MLLGSFDVQLFICVSKMSQKHFHRGLRVVSTHKKHISSLLLHFQITKKICFSFWPVSEVKPEKVIEEVTTSTEEIEQEAAEAPAPTPAPVVPEVASEEPKLTFESVINDQVPVVVEEQPYERIPAECFTNVHDCTANPENRCCDFQ